MNGRNVTNVLLAAGMALGMAGCSSRGSSRASMALTGEPATTSPAAFVRPLKDMHTRVTLRITNSVTDESLHGPYPYGVNATVAPREISPQALASPAWLVNDGYVYLLTDPDPIRASGEAEPMTGRPRLARTTRVTIATPNCKVIVWVLPSPEGTTHERVFHCVDDRPGADGPITVTTLRATIKSVLVPEGSYVDITESSDTLDVSAPMAIPAKTASPSTSVERFLKYVDDQQAAAGLAASPW